MPLVDIECSKCGLVTDIFSVKQAGEIRLGDPCTCPECGGNATRILQPNVITNEDHPRVSKALGFHPDQVEDGTAQSIHPGAEFVKTKGGMYGLVINNRAEKLQRMKERSKYTGHALYEDD